MRTGDRPAPVHVDLGVARLAGPDLAVDDPRPVHDQTGDRLLDVEDLEPAAADPDQPEVGLLAAALGVERGRVEDQLDRLAVPAPASPSPAPDSTARSRDSRATSS